jgi:MFS family permease
MTDRIASKQTWTLVLASLGVFMTALDTLVVATSLPALRADLHASLQSLEWTVNAYKRSASSPHSSARRGRPPARSAIPAWPTPPPKAARRERLAQAVSASGATTNTMWRRASVM